MRSLTLALILALSFGTLVQGQVGVTICACQPSVYTFRFNFSAFCEIQTIDSRPGILGADCFARGIGLGSENTVDIVPVQVTTVNVMEIDKQLRVIAQTPYVNDFRDGDTFTYTSLAASLEGIATLNPDRMPGGIQLDMVGINQLEQPITNVWVILFDNDCNIFPVLEVGDQIGWTILDDLTNPRQEVCPIAPPLIEGSMAPTISAQPSTTPSTEPSPSLLDDQPTTVAPSDPPTNDKPICIPKGKGKGKGKGGMGSKGSGKGGGKGGKGSYDSDDRSGKAGKGGGSADDYGSSGKGGKGGGYSDTHGSSGKGKGGKGNDRRNDRDLEQHPTLHQYLKNFGFDPMPRKVGHNGAVPSTGTGKGSGSSYSSGKGKGSGSKHSSGKGMGSSKGTEECIELPEKKSASSKTKSKLTKLEKGKGKGGDKSSPSSKGSKGKGGKGGSKGKGGKGKGKGSKSYTNSKDSSMGGKGKGKGLDKKTKDNDSKDKYRDSAKESPLYSSSSKGKGGKGKGGSSKASSFGKGKGKGGKGASESTDEPTIAPAQQPNTILPRNSAEESNTEPTSAPTIMTMFTMNMEFLAQSKKKWQEYLEQQNNNRLRK